MKKILITGANSYIGTSFEKYVAENYSSEYVVDTIDMIDGTWREKSFASYDVVFHVAGIAHSDMGKISEEREKLYYSVNTDLCIETAKKCKADGVSQFIFMSSAIVYGNSAKIGKQKVVDKNTLPTPVNCYGKSKLLAEEGITPLSDDKFKVVILRPPIIYGKNCKGNFVTLSNFAKKMKFFPYVKNQRSMLYVENLAEFICLLIKNQDSGIFFPQNAEYSNTSEMVKLIASAQGKKVRLVKGFAWMLKILSVFTGLVNKAFGNMCYEQSISEYKEEYLKFNLEQSILKTEEIDA